MAFQNASRFGYTIVLPVGNRRYTIQSPPVDVGTFLLESTQLAGQRIGLTAELGAFLEELSGLSEDNAEGRARLEAAIKENQEALAVLNDRLTVPTAMEENYFAAVLGEDVYARMRENNEPIEVVKLAASTVSVWVLQGREDAELFWNSGGRVDPPKAPQDRKAKARRGATSR